MRHQSSGTSRKSAQSWQSTIAGRLAASIASVSVAALAERKPRQRAHGVGLGARARRGAALRRARFDRGRGGSPMDATSQISTPSMRDSAKLACSSVMSKCRKSAGKASTVPRTSRSFSAASAPACRDRLRRHEIARHLDADGEIRAARLPERRSRPRPPDRTAARSACRRAALPSRPRDRGAMPTGTATVSPSPVSKRQLEIVARVALAEVAEPDLDLVGAGGKCRHRPRRLPRNCAGSAERTGDLLAVHLKKCAAAGGEAEARDLALRGLDRRSRPAFDRGRPEPEAGKIDARAAEGKPPARRLEADRRRRPLAPIARGEFACGRDIRAG